MKHRPQEAEVAGAPLNNDRAAGLGSDTAAGKLKILDGHRRCLLEYTGVGSGRPKKNAAHCRSGGATGFKKKEVQG